MCCFKCIIVLYRNFLAFHHSKNLENLLQYWNTSGELSLQSFVFLDVEKLKTFKDTIKPSQLGFLNTQSNCWANCALQILLATPLQMILNETTSTIGVLLRNIFQEMLKISTEPLSISSQRVITDACGIKMSRRIHQDIDEFIKTLLHKLMDDDGIGKQVRDIFQISCIKLSRCLKCNEMQGNCTLQNTLNIPIIQLPRSQNTDLESLLKHYSTSEVSKGNMVCKNCKRKPRNHCVKFVKSFPCIFFAVLQRCQYDFLQKKSYLVKTKVNLSNTMDLSFLSLKDIYGTNRIYNLCSAMSRKAAESIEYGHFVTYIFDGEECRVYDDNRINYVPTKSVLVDEEFQRSIDAVSYIRKIDNIQTQSLPNSQ